MTMLITEVRKRQGLSQAKLSHLAGCNAASISRIESGKEPPFRLRAQRIADALGWEGDPMELFEESTGYVDSWPLRQNSTAHTEKLICEAWNDAGTTTARTQCGTWVEPGMRFCPGCGRKIEWGTLNGTNG